jgi:hypothetical protein
MLNHIKEVLFSSNEDAYNFILKRLLNMIKGNRNYSALYLKGPQGGSSLMSSGGRRSIKKKALMVSYQVN